jgi:hypothetical protein
MDPDLSAEDAEFLAELRRRWSNYMFIYDNGTWTGVQVVRSFTADTLQELKQAIEDDYRDRYWGVEP